jgi:hypothetical protein
MLAMQPQGRNACASQASQASKGQALQASQGFEGHPCSDALAHQSKANEGAGLTGRTAVGLTGLTGLKGPLLP